MTNTYKPLTLKLAWNLAAPRSWVAAACPAILGLIFCRLNGYPLRIWQYLPLFLACILLQSSVNTLNDYMDFIKGTDDIEDNLEEKDAVLLYGGIDPKSALGLGIAYLAAGILLGISACLGQGWYPILIGLIGVAVIALYSCGPLPISYLPVGELISGGVMGGLIPLGICACADGALHPEVLLASFPLILGIAMIMLCNNSCDIEKDQEAGRKTFPVTVGRKNARVVYQAAILLWLLSLICLPIYYIGKGGLLCTVLLFLGARKHFLHLWQLKLIPSTRIDQMKTIAATNLMGNGAYCVTLLVACLLQRA